ncbi:4-hydroxy-3-methylbut-2-enyl diphosphate reductase [Adlercreutzia sp. ZJ138]|uniref:4-hydroxy-3-methylbut-2-enyl diphosphate reductase n=1 Tax=Adlercreutzia sp. ZJ138 TaxID=2709405 RepID=UPI0013EAB350|nr:4-hydroxy-3-methylbut-2-enyl diphosphate reductase [Adlercreutzia sp. ZJ138]
MKVLRADCAGACYGVQRALDLAIQAGEGDAVAYTLGPLIHNPQVVAQLSERGVHAVDDLGDIPLPQAAEAVAAVADVAATVAAPGLPGEQAAPVARYVPTVIIRSHGVTPQVKRDALALGLPVVDATCPHVSRAQKAAEELGSCGMHVIVVGEDGHPEVAALVACARETGAEVSVVGDASSIPARITQPVGIVVQTTQKRVVLDRVVDALRERGIEPVVKNTICSATTKRQDAAEQLARQVDAMVVIGGRNSSNTTRLAELCAAACVRAFHIERADEIESAWFDGCVTVGVTAGASTPEDQIASVIARLESL